MKKYKMMALTGILLSSTILGANTSVVQAASANTDPAKAINVDKSSLNNIIQVINDLLGSSSTANKVNAQTKFSELVDGSTYKVAPIFGEQSASTFATALQSELNVVDGSGQLVPMTVVQSDDHGFATEVRYTLDGVTKNINVDYNFGLPTISDSNKVMNFKSNDASTNVNAVATSGVTVNSDNQTDANGNSNKTSYTASPKTVDLTKSKSNVIFTPSDSYKTGISSTRDINVYQEPDWAKVSAAVKIQSGDDVTKDNQIYTNESGQSYSVAMSNYKAADTGTTGTVDYTLTAIDSKGNVVNDSLDNKTPISFSKTGQSVAVNSDITNPNYTIVFTDGGNVVGTAIGTGLNAYGKVTIPAATVEAAAEKAGLELKTTPVDKSFDTTKTVNNLSQSYEVTKQTKNVINYVDVTSGPLNKTEDLNGANGSTTILKDIPLGYRLVNTGDFMQTLNADQPNRDVYVTPINLGVKNLSYTVTFRDKDTGKVVGSQVNSEGALGDYIGLTAPDGYAFASILDNGFVLLKNDQQVTKYVKAANTPYNISYVDQDTNKEVGTQSGKGADGSKVTLKAPTDYAFVNADDMTYTIDKDDTATKTIYVQKSNQTVDNIVSGYPKNGYIKIYDASGKLNKDVVLSEGSSWIIDRTVTINGAEYYRVATNEYVKASDVYTYTPLQSIVTTKGVNVTPVYNSRGQLVIDLALDTNTPWYTDRSATIKGSKMYRVATDQWVKASDVTLK